jgi:hypothetical protein
MSLLTDLDALSTEHRGCDDLDAGVEGEIVWIACDCGVSMAIGRTRRSWSRPGHAGGTGYGENL